MCTIFDIKKTLLSICVAVNDTPQKCILVHNIPPQAKINSQNDSKNGRKFDLTQNSPGFSFVWVQFAPSRTPATLAGLLRSKEHEPTSFPIRYATVTVISIYRHSFSAFKAVKRRRAHRQGKGWPYATSYDTHVSKPNDV